MTHHSRALRLSSQVAARLYTTIITVVFFSVADQALGHSGALPVNATILCVIALLPHCAGAIASGTTAQSTRPSTALSTLWANRLSLGSFLLIVLVSMLGAALPGAYWEEGGKWIALLPYGLCITVCSMALALDPWTTRNLSILILASLAALTGSIWYDTLFPGSFADLENRAAGFPGNANFSALVAVLLCSAGLDLGGPGRSSLGATRLAINIILLVLTSAVVILSMSRSGFLNLACLIALFVYFRVFASHKSVKSRALELTVLLAFAGAATCFTIWFATSSASSQGNSRLTRLLHNEQVDDGSAGTRLAAVRDCLRLIEASPFVGHGTGFARTMNELPHNLYLQQWVNNGIFGIGSYLLLLLSAFATFTNRGCRNGQAFIIAAVVGSIFSHNLLDQRPFLMLLGILLARSHQDRRPQGTYALLQLRHSAPTHSPEPQVAWVDSTTVA